MRGIIFRQLFEKESSTYTYLLGCRKTRNAVLIDPVLETVDRDTRLIKDLNLKLIYGINTHVHADHITGTHNLRSNHPDMKTGLGNSNEAKSDVKFDHGQVIKVGETINLEVRATPGHTEGCVTYVEHEHGLIFTGDAVLIRGCGRTDFQGGSPKTLYNSIMTQIFTLPDDFSIYPAHDYKGETSSTVYEEKTLNPRLSKPEDDFIKIMDNLNLAYPKKIDVALPWNLNCGADPN